MAEPNKPATDDSKNDKPDGKKPEPPAVKSLSVDTEKELRAEVAVLKEKLQLVEGQNKALEELLAEQETARAAAKAKKESGPRVPLAKIAIIGEGRRHIAPGSQLRQGEIGGLTEGVHYELGALDG